MRTRTKWAVGLASLIFLVLVGAVSASAYWSDHATVSSSVQVANLADSCVHPTTVTNASFEVPVVNNAANWEYAPNGAVDGWTSTDPSGIEIWKNGANGLGVNAPVGNQFIELNATTDGILSQTIATTPGQTLQWSLWHRGRAGDDTMQVMIGAPGLTTVQRQITDGIAAWGRYSGAYVVPAGQTSTQLSFQAVSTGGTHDKSIGNFLDDVAFGTGPCLSATSTAANLSDPGSSVFHIGDLVQYTTTVANSGSAPSVSSVLRDTVPASLLYQPKSLTIDGITRTDATGDDSAEYSAGAGGTGTIVARLGTGATPAAGGAIAQGTTSVVTFIAKVMGPLGATGTATIDYAPSVTYVNELAPNWPLSPATVAHVAINVTGVADVAVVATPPAAALIPGAPATSVWTFSVSNIGTATASNVSVHLSGPTGFSGTTIPTVGTTPCSAFTTTSADCAIGTLAAGASTTITLVGGVVTGTAPGAFAIQATATSSSPDANAGNNSATGTAMVVDNVLPGPIYNLVATNLTTSQVTLTWGAAGDNVGVTAYDIYRDGKLSTTVSASAVTYTDTGLAASTSYTYQVIARDAAGNSSTGVSITVTTPAAVTVFAPNTFYTIKNPNSGLCLDTSASPAANGTQLIINTCSSSDPYQAWQFATTVSSTKTTSGYYAVLPKVSGTVLGWDVTDVSTASGAKVQLWSFGGGANQQWMPALDTSGGTYHFTSLNTGMCLDINGASKTAGTQLQQYVCNGTAAQSFTLTAVK